MGSGKENTNRGSAGRSLFLSIIAPGLGEFVQGDTARALFMLLIRPLSLIFPVAYLYSRRESSLPFATAAVSIVLLVNIVSPIVAYRMASGNRSKHTHRRIPACVLFFIIHWLSLFIALYSFLTVFSVRMLRDNGGYPSLPEGSVVLVSVREPSVFISGDSVLLEKNGGLTAVRVLCAEEGAYVEYRGGIVSVFGNELPQTIRGARELSMLGLPNDERIYFEQNYCIVRNPTDEKVKKVRYDLSQGELVVCLDNRIGAEPFVIRRTNVIARIDTALFVPQRGML
jgi:hypothetical protein